ncbi:hypothetical protein [Staphylococcus capitis]|uniref:Phage protein n=1 Tax=Staphylococcus capitis TaxID=29388 RepID=A0ABX1STM3_STACP|nr:hypothetical protein [Staphylococcus capitis]NMK54667.1 hypothetical protein [Staphylococcus capitis]NMK69903.1 hypothetical protein [Staphylococcus capitis]
MAYHVDANVNMDVHRLLNTISLKERAIKELLDVLTTIDTTNVSMITFEDEDVTPINDFIAEYQITTNHLEEAENDLETLKANYLEMVDAEEREDIEAEFNGIINDYGELLREDVWVQSFEIDNGQIKVKLS